jgi:hypothetical protein
MEHFLAIAAVERPSARLRRISFSRAVSSTGSPSFGRHRPERLALDGQGLEPALERRLFCPLRMTWTTVERAGWYEGSRRAKPRATGAPRRLDGKLNRWTASFGFSRSW